MRLDHVQGVAAARVVRVAPGVGLQPVVPPVVDALQGQRGPQLARLRRVVVDHVEDDLDPGGVQGAHHALELADLLPRRTGGRVGRMGREVADRVVAPVVLEAAPQQVVLVRELVDGEQLDGRDAEFHEVLDRGRVRQPGVRPAQFLGDVGVQRGEPPHMHLVDHRVGPRGLRAAVLGPVVVIVDDHALRDVRRRVPVVPYGVRDLLLGPVADMAVHLWRQAEVAVHRAGVRVEEQLRGVPAGTGPRVPAAVHPEAVALAGHDTGHEAVPDLVGELGELGPGLLAVRVEQTQLDRLGPARPQREVGPRHPVRADPEPGAQRRRRTGPHRHGGHLALRAVHERGGALLGGFGHRLLLGCAGHRSASHGSWSNAEKGARRPGRDTPRVVLPTVLPSACLALTFPRAGPLGGLCAGRVKSGARGRVPGVREAGARTASYSRFPGAGPSLGSS